MYTATIESKTIDKPNRQFVVTVVFTHTNGETLSEVFRFGFDITFEQMKRQIKLRKEALEQLESNVSNVIEGAVDLSTVPDTAPTQAELDKMLWVQRDYLYEQVLKAIEKGYIQPNAPKVLQLKSWLTNNFKPEYIDLV